MKQDFLTETDRDERCVEWLYMRKVSPNGVITWLNLLTDVSYPDNDPNRPSFDAEWLFVKKAKKRQDSGCRGTEDSGWLSGWLNLRTGVECFYLREGIDNLYKSEIKIKGEEWCKKRDAYDLSAMREKLGLKNEDEWFCKKEVNLDGSVMWINLKTGKKYPEYPDNDPNRPSFDAEWLFVRAAEKYEPGCRTQNYIGWLNLKTGETSFSSCGENADKKDDWYERMVKGEEWCKKKDAYDLSAIRKKLGLKNEDEWLCKKEGNLDGSVMWVNLRTGEKYPDNDPDRPPFEAEWLYVKKVVEYPYRQNFGGWLNLKTGAIRFFGIYQGSKGSYYMEEERNIKGEEWYEMKKAYRRREEEEKEEKMTKQYPPLLPSEATDQSSRSARRPAGLPLTGDYLPPGEKYIAEGSGAPECVILPPPIDQSPRQASQAQPADKRRALRFFMD